MKRLDDPTVAELNSMAAELPQTRQYHVANVSRPRLNNALSRAGIRASVRQQDDGFLVTYVAGGGAQIGVRSALDRIAPRGSMPLGEHGFTREAVERVIDTLPGKRFAFQAQEGGDTLVVRVD